MTYARSSTRLASISDLALPPPRLPGPADGAARAAFEMERAHQQAFMLDAFEQPKAPAAGYLQNVACINDALVPAKRCLAAPTDSLGSIGTAPSCFSVAIAWLVRGAQCSVRAATSIANDAREFVYKALR